MRPADEPSEKNKLPGRGVEITTVQAWQAGVVERTLDSLAAEEPLEIRVNGSPLSVTMRTPGNDLELAAGFLLTEGIIQGREQIVSLDYVPQEKQLKQNIVDAALAEDAEFDGERSRRNFFAASSCGMCGKASIEAIRVRGIRAPNADLRVAPEVLCGLPERLREGQSIFTRTGGLHAAALFDVEGKLIEVREDIGRHNAVDKLIGWAMLNGFGGLGNCLMLVSGRGGFEIVQKCLVAGVPLLASVSAPSSLAVKLAREFQMTLVGFLRGKRFVVYAGEQRIVMGNGSDVDLSMPHDSKDRSEGGD
jgi:FdhD protein